MYFFCANECVTTCTLGTNKSGTVNAVCALALRTVWKTFTTNEMYLILHSCNFQFQVQVKM